MPPSKTAKAPKAKQKAQEEQREEVLQAVVLADTFETRFAPFTLKRPRCLLPLANTPLIEYTLEFLANAGVQEVLLTCRNHADQVEEYINSSKWKLKPSPFRNFTIIKSTSDSVGGVMRDLERAETITGDFLLVSGDVISNISLESSLASHRARREKDKNAIMTMILREARIGQRVQSKCSRPVFVIDSATNRCVHYEELGRGRGSNRHVTLDPEILTSSGEVDVREDLIDCRIDICTQDVLLAWSDNFDFTTVRKSFLRGVLKDFETYGKTVHTYVLTGQYAARLKSLRAYDTVSRDIIGRWTYPFCPDSNLMVGQSYYPGAGKNYLEDPVTIGENIKLRKSIIGGGTIIGDGSTITSSTLGRRCKIGKNVIIEGAYIWDDVSVEDNATVLQAIVADATVIGKGCKIETAALVSYESRLPENTTIPGGRSFTKDQTSLDLEIAGVDESDGSSIASSSLVYQSPSESSSNSSISTLASSDTDLEPPDTSRRGSFRSDASDEAGENRDFHLEAAASILDGLQKDDPPDTIILELNGYRMSTNASQHEVRKALVAAFLKRISVLVNGDASLGKHGISAREAVKNLFSTYQTLIERTLFDKDAELKVDQVDFLLLMQKEVLARPSGDQLLLFVANEAYDQDILEEDGILQWWENERSKEGDMLRVRGLTQPFITYLQEAEEEEDESDDAGESEDDEE